LLELTLPCFLVVHLTIAVPYLFPILSDASEHLGDEISSKDFQMWMEFKGYGAKKNGE